MAEMDVDCAAEEEKKRPRDEGENEDVPAQKKLIVSSEEAEPAAEERKETLAPEAIETEKDEGTPPEAEAEVDTNTEAEAKVEDEKEESDPAPAAVGKLEEVSATPSEAKIGPKVFTSSMDMFNFFYELLHAWPLDFNLNKYEHLVLEDLINKGHLEHHKKIGSGVEAFQVRVNPEFYSRCYYIIRTDGSIEDFSYRKCVDNILPLPEEVKSRSGDLRVGSKNRGQGGGKHGKGGGGWGGRRGGGGGYGKGNHGHGRRF